MIHSHKFEIADPEAILCLIEKIEKHAQAGDGRHERLRKAMAWAEKQAKSLEGGHDEKQMAFYHGLLTGYGVALNLQT